MVDLTGTNIVVSGGAGGIGSAAVRALGAAGARIAVIDLPDSPPESLDQSTTHYSSCDITQRERVEAVFREIEDWFGEVHVLFNAAAYEAGPNRSIPAENLSDRDLELQFNVNVFGTIHVTQAAFPSMRRAGGGRVVNFTSIAAVRGLPTSAHYAASKGAIGAWTRSVALEWAQYNICVNAVSPLVDTGRLRAQREAMAARGPEAREIYAQQMKSIPLGRLGDADADIAPALVFLASKGAGFITGQTLAIDGGMMMLGS
jgi:NAD(P)-dependent dehydrogenase (short-subunit alcohol dehydrogenase family)